MSTEHFADWDGTIRHREIESVDLLGALAAVTGRAAFRREDSDYRWPALESEPDFEQIIEDRFEHDFDENAAQDAYDRTVYGP